MAQRRRAVSFDEPENKTFTFKSAPVTSSADGTSLELFLVDRLEIFFSYPAVVETVTPVGEGDPPWFLVWSPAAFEPGHQVSCPFVRVSVPVDTCVPVVEVHSKR